jgi:hypothetical protein
VEVLLFSASTAKQHARLITILSGQTQLKRHVKVRTKEINVKEYGANLILRMLSVLLMVAKCRSPQELKKPLDKHYIS